MDILLDSLRGEWQALLAMAPRLGLGLVVFLLVAIMGRLAARAMHTVLERGNLAETHREFFRRLLIWVFYIFGLTVALQVIGLSGIAASIITGGGVTAVVLGFAFREIGENFLAGLFLAFNRPFNVGDLIQSGDLEGVVRGIQLRSTHVRTADGKDVFIPSSQIFKAPLINYTIDGLRRFGFTVGIDYGDDPLAASALLAERVKRNPDVLADPAPFAGVANLAPNYVELQVHYWINTFDTNINVLKLRSEMLADCRQTLLDRGFTLSHDITTNIALSSRAAIDVAMASTRAEEHG